MEEKMKFSIRTDLAIEAKELAEENRRDIGDGVAVKSEETEDMSLTYVKILNDRGAREMGKPIGTYITIESESLRENDNLAHEAVGHRLKECIVELSGAKEDALFLIVGLGNWNITPDALGPKVVDKLLVTRHMHGTMPESIADSVRPMAAISPGVMGITGIETGEIILGLVEKIKPDVVIAVDALAARKFSRINSTIQLSDTGISPGAGVGNKRMTLDKASLGVPVIAIGVPTVVDAATLANDTIDLVIEQLREQTTQGTMVYEMLENLEEDDRYGLIAEILTPYAQNMFVTPKEVDSVIERLAKIIAGAINAAVHPGIDIEDLGRYTN